MHDYIDEIDTLWTVNKDSNAIYCLICGEQVNKGQAMRVFLVNYKPVGLCCASSKKEANELVKLKYSFEKL